MSISDILHIRLSFHHDIIRYYTIRADKRDIGIKMRNNTYFASTDLLSNDDTSTDLFKLNTNTTTVSNVYPSDVTVLSGGGTTLSGVPAVTGGTGGTGSTGGTGGTGGAGALMIQAGANSYQ